MTRTVRTLIPIVLLLAPIATGQPGPDARADAATGAASRVMPRAFMPMNSVPPQERNAALKYWSAWSLFMTPDLAQRASELDWTAIGSTTDKAALPDAVRKASEGAKAFADALGEASCLEKCDFEIEYEKGVALLLPHLGKARQSARILRADARWLTADGKPDAATERITTLFRLAAHMRGDGVMISSLLGSAVGTIATEEAAALLASGSLTPANRDALLEVTENLDPADPYAVGKTLDTERVVFLGWMREKFTGPDAGKRLLEEMGVFTWPDESSVMHAAKMAVGTMDAPALAAALAELDRFYAEALQAWPRPDADDALNALAESVSRNAYGPLAMIMSPSLTKARESTTRIANRLADLRADLQAWKAPQGNAAAPSGR